MSRGTGPDASGRGVRTARDRSPSPPAAKPAPGTRPWRGSDRVRPISMRGVHPRSGGPADQPGPPVRADAGPWYGFVWDGRSGPRATGGAAAAGAATAATVGAVEAGAATRGRGG